MLFTRRASSEPGHHLVPNASEAPNPSCPEPIGRSWVLLRGATGRESFHVCRCRPRHVPVTSGKAAPLRDHEPLHRCMLQRRRDLHRLRRCLPGRAGSTSTAARFATPPAASWRVRTRPDTASFSKHSLPTASRSAAPVRMHATRMAIGIGIARSAPRRALHARKPATQCWQRCGRRRN